MNLIESVESEHIKTDIPDFGPGDLVSESIPVSERVQKNGSKPMKERSFDDRTVG